MKFILQISMFALCISCNAPYKPNGHEKLILENSSKNNDLILQFDHKKFHEIHEVIWDEIEFDGKRSMDLKIGISTDSVFTPVIKCLQFIDTCFEKMEQKRTTEISISEFKTLYDTALNIKSRKNINFWNTVIEKRNSNNDPTALEEVYRQLFDGHNQKDVLTQLKFSLYNLYINILESYIQELGSSTCWMGPSIRPIVIISPKSPDLKSPYDVEVYLMDYHIFHSIYRNKSYYKGTKLPFNRHEAILSIPITDTILGKKTFDVVSSFKYLGREFKSTTTGHYFVVK